MGKGFSEGKRYLLVDGQFEVEIHHPCQKRHCGREERGCSRGSEAVRPQFRKIRPPSICIGHTGLEFGELILHKLQMLSDDGPMELLDVAVGLL